MNISVANRSDTNFHDFNVNEKRQLIEAEWHIYASVN